MVGQNLKPGYCVVILIMKGESDHATWCSTWWRIGISVVVSSWSKWLVCWSFKALCLFWSILISVYTMLMLVGEKILPTLCLLEITWNNKGYPVKLVYKCMYVRVITRIINSLPMKWLVEWRNSITMENCEEYQKNCCLLGRYFGQFACNSKVFRPPGGYSTLSWVRMCGPKFRPPPYNKTREDARGGTRLWLGRGCAARTSGP